MGKKPFSNFMVFLFSFLPLLFLCSCCPCKCIKGDGAETNGLFVFGSSLVDNGNNNFLESSTSRADYLPYGIDFPLGPTGRFSNGKNVIDHLGELLKLPCFIPPFNNPTTKGDKILQGVNFASGGSGILDETGSISGRVITLRQQIKNYKKVTLPQLAHQLRCGGSKSLISSGILSKYLFVIGTGGNDYLLNYFLRNSSSTTSIEAFTANLTIALSRKLKKLYSLGARKFVLISIYPIGCIPVVTTTFGIRHGCILALNQAASLFNTHLKSLVDVIKPQMPGSNLVYLNSYKIISDIINDPNPIGFNDTISSCCEVSGNGILCKRGGNTCGHRNSHVFFDGLHPTQAVNVLVANIAYASSSSIETYPINKLYSLGARKFVLISIYPIGCIPVVTTTLGIRHGCILALNQAASLFNTHLKSLVDVIKPQMPGSNLVYLNSYKIISDIINDPNPIGFNDTISSCCEVSGNGILCKRGGIHVDIGILMSSLMGCIPLKL